MADPILDDLLDLFPDTITVHPGYLDGTGGFIPSGAVASYPAFISGGQRLIRDTDGQEVVSTVFVLVGATPTLTTDRHRYTIPSRFIPDGSIIPSGQLQAISARKVSDENGPHHEELYFP